MANSEALVDGPGGATPAKVPLLPLLLCVLAAALLAVGGSGGVVYLLAKSGKLALGGGGVETHAVKAASEVPTHALAMEPLLANLADADGRGYLRLGVLLQIEDRPANAKKEEKDAKAPSTESARLRDTVLEVLGHAKSADLLAPDGKEQLKKRLKEKFVEEDSATKVREVFFTDFLVQR